MNEETSLAKGFNKQNLIGIVIVVVLVALGAYWFGSKHSTAPIQPSTSNTTTQPSTQSSDQVIDYTEAPNHLGQNIAVRGRIVKVASSNKGTIFLDYCSNYKGCPFSVVVFNSNTGSFSDLNSYEGKTITIKGFIRTYQNRPEIILNNQSQIIQVE